MKYAIPENKIKSTMMKNVPVDDKTQSTELYVKRKEG